jgi:hypothetical protein
MHEEGNTIKGFVPRFDLRWNNLEDYVITFV